ncbi:hypothetical protein TD95_003705 [Thielaviopsis punctulata]|uniref:G-protein coupled receptors family 2 profile 2 domain-containing protein n=1 Tax=Thielaviopsis punctulata TaxID=72032 RepID=A0A0F4ZGE0_9PEZI|nr:hypothetical protein TD95_003705 [Thielaviopsis punctulata]
MASFVEQLRGGCPVPFYNQDSFSTTDGFIDGRVCQAMANLGNITCCLPCPLVDWVYPDSFDTMASAADWASVVGTICCIFLLASWLFLPVEKTHRHYLSICLTVAVAIMNMGFVVPLAANPEQCINPITPNDMSTSSVCAASGTLIMLGGFAGMMWVFLRALSLHLQICWQVVVGRNFMWFAQATGWIIPIIIVSVALNFSGVSFRFGQTCHVNHDNSLADFWIPMLVFSGLTVFLQGATFVYCIKVYLESLADSSTTTEGSGLPTYSNNTQMTISPRQAYRRVKRVIQLQWRGITIVLIILMDVIFFSVVFVFQDRTMEAARLHPDKATEWITCIVEAGGDKSACTNKTSDLVVAQPTLVAVLMLLSINGVWLLLFLGTWNMASGWVELVMKTLGFKQDPTEFVSKDAALKTKSYELLSRETTTGMGQPTRPAPTRVNPVNSSRGAFIAVDTKSPISPFTDTSSPGGQFNGKMPSPYVDSPISPADMRRSDALAASPSVEDGRRTPDYFGTTARYHAPSGSFSSPNAPRSPPPAWSPESGAARSPRHEGDLNPLGMNRI